MSSTRAPLFILALFFLCLYATGSVSSVDTWIDDGKGGVYWESSYGKISAYPAIAKSYTMSDGFKTPYTQLLNFSYNASSPSLVNISFVFQGEVTSESMELYNNFTQTRYIPGRENGSAVINVTGYKQLSYSPVFCDLGDVQNSFAYLVNGTYLGYYYENAMVCFNSMDIANAPLYTIYYQIDGSIPEYYNALGWENIDILFNYINIEGNTVYTINNVLFNNETLYQTKIKYYSDSDSGKYDIYVHSGSPSDVVEGKGKIYLELDPWWNASINMTCDYNTSTTYNISSFTPINNFTYPTDIDTILIINNGTKMLIGSNARHAVVEYNLTSAYNVSSAIYNCNLSITGTSAGKENQLKGLQIIGNGTKLYFVGSSRDKLIQYNLTTPYSICGGATYHNEIAVGLSIPHGLFISENSSFVFISSFSDTKVYSYIYQSLSTGQDGDYEVIVTVSDGTNSAVAQDYFTLEDQI
jgi:hypothetical protein